MTPFLKPRGFWDYALSAFVLAGMLLLLFWVEANRIVLADAAMALGGGLLFIFAVILARRGEKAKWIARPTWQVPLAATLVASVFVFGALYADAHLVHHKGIPSDRLLRDLIFILVPAAGTTWMSRRRQSHSERHLH